MKFLKIFRFELAYQTRRLTTPLYFIAVGTVAFLFTRGNFLADALYANFFLNSPYVIAVVTVFCSLFWLLVVSAVAGELAARDSETGMHPLSYTSPVSKAEYLGGRFLAAFVLNAAIMLAVPAGVMLSVYSPGVDAAAIGPFRPAAYLSAYGFLALPNVFIGTAIQFSCATLNRRALAGYMGSVLLFSVVYGGIFLMMYFGVSEKFAALLDALGQLTVLDMTKGWTTIEKSKRLIWLDGALLRSRILWISIALATLAFTYFRFRFTHHTLSPLLPLASLKIFAKAGFTSPKNLVEERIALSKPSINQRSQPFNYATWICQTRFLAWTSFRTIAMSPSGLPLLTIIATLTAIIVPEQMTNLGTPLLPRTAYLLTFLTAPFNSPITPWIIIPFLIISYAGELVWRERKAGLGELMDAAPVPDLVRFIGKFLGLSLLLFIWVILLMIAGIAVQLRMGYHEFEIGLYLKVLFGLQLQEYLFFALLAIMVQGIVAHKYIGHLVTLIVYAAIVTAPWLDIRHHLLIYGTAPAWTYSDMNGFGASLVPWLWFKIYWCAWALLLSVIAKLFWMRGIDGGPGVRFKLARGRITRTTSLVAAAALGLILTIGGFIFYNTNVLNEYATNSDFIKLRAEYERSYSQFRHTAQPRLASTFLHIELYPKRKEMEIRGTYRLVNHHAATIDSIHIATIRSLNTGIMSFDRPATLVRSDDNHGHRIYALQRPLKPGDSLLLRFTVNVKQKGFRNGGVDHLFTTKSTFFRNLDVLPAIGYQGHRELIKPGERGAQGLVVRPLIPTLADVESAGDITGEDDYNRTGDGHVSFEAVIGTDGDQTAVAPGELRRTWTEGDSTGPGGNNRRYFHYATDAAIGNEFRFFASTYKVHEELWKDTSSKKERAIAIQIYHYPQHKANIERMLRSVRASLACYTRAFGPYPYSYIRLIENPGTGMGAHADAATIDYTEGFSRFNPSDDPKEPDMPFAIIAHEMAHQWGVPYAFAEGAPLLSESFAWYAAMGVVESTYGRAHLQRLRRFFRQPHPIPPIRQSLPLLRATDPYAAYRKGPFALFAMSEYMGADKVNLAFRRLIEKHRSGAPPLATTLDLYRELRVLTPDTLRYLLHDLFAANTFWDLKTKQASAKRTNNGTWQVALNVQARKFTVDSAGVETIVPINEWIELGVFAPTGEGREFGKTLYLEKHRIHSGEQSIVVTVPDKPADAGIDPFHLLIDLEPYDNVEKVKIKK